jgi:hypothetical protein
LLSEIAGWFAGLSGLVVGLIASSLFCWLGGCQPDWVLGFAATLADFVRFLGILGLLHWLSAWMGLLAALSRRLSEFALYFAGLAGSLAVSLAGWVAGVTSWPVEAAG